MTDHNPTWETTVNNDARKFGHILEFSEAAWALGYEYICWNHVVYHVWEDERGDIWTHNTQLLRKDVK